MLMKSNLRLLYPASLPAPSNIYQAQAGGPWRPLPVASLDATSCTDVTSTVSILGYFMAGYVPAKASGFRLGGGQTLPIAVALVILLVVLAGIPLAVVRRRSGVSEEGPE